MFSEFSVNISAKNRSVYVNPLSHDSSIKKYGIPPPFRSVKGLVHNRFRAICRTVLKVIYVQRATKGTEK